MSQYMERAAWGEKVGIQNDSAWFEPGNFVVHNRIQGFPATRGSVREAEWWIDASV